MLEPDDDDRYITKTVFEENRFDVRITFVTTADELFGHLKSNSKNRSDSPSLILLNYHSMPSTAAQILSELKNKTSSFSHIPVVVLSGTVNNEIIQECYAAGASSFIQKPSRSDETNNKISNFFNYWFGTVELPR